MAETQGITPAYQWALQKYGPRAFSVRVVGWYFGLDGQRRHTLQEIAQLLGNRRGKWPQRAGWRRGKAYTREEVRWFRDAAIMGWHREQLRRERDARRSLLPPEEAK